MTDASGQSPNDYPDDYVHLSDRYLGKIEDIDVAWCHTCETQHFHCPTCTSRACAHIVDLVRTLHG